jgi:tRNA-Thr(GGU) m(6)t(6)A37 methyltransferase TsaA
MDKIKYMPIGIIHSPFKKLQGIPIQPTAAKGIKGTVEIFPEYIEGLKDIEGFSHIILIFYFHLSKKTDLKVKPYMDEQTRGVFATRAPSRPNPIGLSVVRLVGVEGTILHIKDVDIVNGTPLLDIKPYVPEFDGIEVAKIGWLEQKTTEDLKNNSHAETPGTQSPSPNFKYLFFLDQKSAIKNSN